MNNQGPSRLELPRYLAALPLFDGASSEDLARVARGCVLRGYDRGQPVFRAGERCDAFHVALLGHVKLYVPSCAGQEKVIDIAAPGQTFAEALMFTGAPYDMNAEALTGALVLSVGKAVVVAEIERDPRFSMRMLDLVARRVRGLVRDVEDYTLCNAAQRVISYLLRELAAAPCGACSGTVSLPVSKATLASRLSLTPEYFSRVLHELEDEGLICIEGRHIRIPDPDQLAARPVH
jgi:CRP-like cAMP-binding protein